LPPKNDCAPLAVVATHNIFQFASFVRRTDPSFLGSPRGGPEFTTSVAIMLSGRSAIIAPGHCRRRAAANFAIR